MPTAAKLFACVLMGALAYVVAKLVGEHLPPETQKGALIPVSVFFGLLVGWRFLGRRIGRGAGMRSAMGLGLSAVVALLLVAMVFFAGYEMIRRAMRMAYGGNPFEALQDMMQIILDNTEYLYHGDVIAALVLGGVVVGALTEAVARRWT